MRPLARIHSFITGLVPVRIALESVRRFHKSRAAHMASSLSFQTLVSTVPVLLFLVGILRWFIPGDPARQIHDFMHDYLVPEVAAQVTDFLLDLIENVNFAALGWIGAVGTFLATYMLILNLKGCLNDLGFRSRRSGVFKRLGWVTIVVILVVPLTWLIAIEGRVFYQLPSFMAVARPYVTTVGVLFLVYKLLPDRGPSTRASLLSASLIGLLLELEKIGLAYYVRQVEGVYEVIYGTLMFLPLLLGWLYLSWSLLLFGGTLALAADEVTGRRQHTVIPPGA